jgi:hypothetical protein
MYRQLGWKAKTGIVNTLVINKVVAYTGDIGQLNSRTGVDGRTRDLIPCRIRSNREDYTQRENVPWRHSLWPILICQENERLQTSLEYSLEDMNSTILEICTLKPGMRIL